MFRRVSLPARSVACRVLLLGGLALLWPAPGKAAGEVPARDEQAGRPVVNRPPPERLHGLGQLRYDAVYLARRPFTLGSRGRTKLYATAGATLALYLLREEIRDWVQDHRSPGRTRFLDDARTMGKGAFAPALALIGYGASFATGNPREKETALLLLESATYSAFTALGGSYVLATERPEQGDSIRFFHASGRGVSLDAALAASVVTPLRRQYLRVRPGDGTAMRVWKRSATVVLYGGAVLTGFQRLDRDKHWAPDVFLGLSAGFNIGKMLCDSHDEARRRRLDMTVAPAPQGAALSVRWTP